VVAAVLRDARARILLGRRGDGRDLAGLWEFPGGKVEPGESPGAAVARELHEELGIEIGASRPLIAVPHAYEHKRIRLDVYEIASFRGRARGREAQALAWVVPEKLATYPMPAADRPVVAALLQPDRYLITPDVEDGAFLERVDRALEAGVRRVQLRVRAASHERQHALARAIRDRLAARRGELLLNSALHRAHELALELDCGLHLTSAALAAGVAASAPRPRWLAASCHDAEQLRRAEAADCDFAVLGPLAATPSHPETNALGWARFAALRAGCSLPVYALGGMDLDDVAIARAHGAQGVAAIRALWPNAPAGG
jgi:8-oxo-dGTP diphosphatase